MQNTANPDNNSRDSNKTKLGHYRRTSLLAIRPVTDVSSAGFPSVVGLATRTPKYWVVTSGRPASTKIKRAPPAVCPVAEEHSTGYYQPELHQLWTG